MTQIEVFQASSMPALKPRKEGMDAALIEGNAGSLVLIRLHAGELEMHTHEQEHVGVLLEGGFEFITEDEVVPIRVGDIYRVLPNVPHGVRCPDHALIVQGQA